MKNNGTMTFKVGKGRPVPTAYAGRKYDWPFEKMKVGESFVFPIGGNGNTMATYVARGIIMRNARFWRVTGRRFITRLMPDRKGIGVWRVE